MIQFLSDGAPSKGKKVYDWPMMMDRSSTTCLYFRAMRKPISDMIIHLSSDATLIPLRVRACLTWLK